MTQTHLTGAGRIISGSLLKGSNRGYQNRELIGSDGQPRTEYFILVAFPKADPETAKLEAYLMSRAREDWAGYMARWGGDFPKKFSYKFVDGDSTDVDDKNRRYCDKPFHAGNLVVRFTQPTSPPRVYDAQRKEVKDPGQIKCGDWVQIQLQAKGNNTETYPGIYVEHRMVGFVRYGEEIQGGADPDEVFGAAPVDARYAEAAGASATPVAGSAPRPVANTGAPPSIAPAAAHTAPVPANVQPAANFGQAPPPPAAAPPPPATPIMSATCPYTYADLKAQNWTDEQMIAVGYLADPVPF